MNDYPPIIARRQSECSICPDPIFPGDAIAMREFGQASAHLACALAADDHDEHRPDREAELLAAHQRVHHRVTERKARRLWDRAGLRRKRKERVRPKVGA